jgi:hypothetical protein
MPSLEQRVARHDREIAEIRRLLLKSAAEHVKSRKEMREIRETQARAEKEMQAIRAAQAIAEKEMRELLETKEGVATRGNGHRKRRIS